VIKLRRGKIVSSRLGEVIDPWVKRTSCGKKKPDLNLAQELMMYFPQEGCHYFTPRRLITFYPKEKISRFSE
jgi:hypothetical protein